METVGLRRETTSSVVSEFEANHFRVGKDEIRHPLIDMLANFQGVTQRDLRNSDIAEAEIEGVRSVTLYRESCARGDGAMRVASNPALQRYLRDHAYLAALDLHVLDAVDDESLSTANPVLFACNPAIELIQHLSVVDCSQLLDLAAAPAREVLKRWGIGINDAANGVFLPATLKSPNPIGAAVHSTLHTEAYYQAVNRALRRVKTRQEALQVLPSGHLQSLCLARCCESTASFYRCNAAMLSSGFSTARGLWTRSTKKHPRSAGSAAGALCGSGAMCSALMSFVAWKSSNLQI